MESSKYTARWQHRFKLTFRVWPKWKLTHETIVAEKDIPINAIRLDKDGQPELWHQRSGKNADVFELSDDDFDILTAIPKAGARMTRRGMVVHAPGTINASVKKECWLTVHVLAYAEASEKRITPWGREASLVFPKVLHGETPEDALGLAGMGGSKIVYFERDEDIDEDVVLREVLENDAMIVLGRQPLPGKRDGVTSDAGRRLVDRALYWTIPGRDPCADGGVLRGYQFPDRIVRWLRRSDPANSEVDAERRLDLMHERTREKGRSNRRTYFLDRVVNRFAERVGMSRQRVMARFLDEGIVDWLMRSVDNVKPIPCRETSSLLRGRISDAVNALEFYYRAVESLQRGGES